MRGDHRCPNSRQFPRAARNSWLGKGVTSSGLKGEDTRPSPSGEQDAGPPSQVGELAEIATPLVTVIMAPDGIDARSGMMPRSTARSS